MRAPSVIMCPEVLKLENHNVSNCNVFNEACATEIGALDSYLLNPAKPSANHEILESRHTCGLTATAKVHIS